MQMRRIMRSPLHCHVLGTYLRALLRVDTRLQVMCTFAEDSIVDERGANILLKIVRDNFAIQTAGIRIRSLLRILEMT